MRSKRSMGEYDLPDMQRASGRRDPLPPKDIFTFTTECRMRYLHGARKMHLGPGKNRYLCCGEKGLIDSCPFWDEDGNAYIIHGYAKEPYWI